MDNKSLEIGGHGHSFTLSQSYPENYEKSSEIIDEAGPLVTDIVDAVFVATVSWLNDSANMTAKYIKKYRKFYDKR